MSSTKQTSKAQISQQRKTFTLQITKNQANFFKTILPLRHIIQLYSQRNDRNTLKSSLQAKKNQKSKGKCRSHPKLESPDTCEPKQKIRQNAKDSQIEVIRQNKFLGALKEGNVLQPSQNQIAILMDSIMKFFEAMRKDFSNEKEVENNIVKIKSNFKDSTYGNFIEFEQQIKTIVDKISLDNPKEQVLKEFNTILSKIQLYFKQLSIKRNQQKSKSQNKKQKSNKIVELSSLKTSKNLKKTIKLTQKQLKSRNVKGKIQKKNATLPQGLFVVAEETQSSINSMMQIDSLEAGRINMMLKKLHIVEQEQLLKTLTHQGRIKSIKNLTCREAEEFVAKIKKMLRASGREYLNEQKEIQSSFQVEDEE